MSTATCYCFAAISLGVQAWFSRDCALIQRVADGTGVVDLAERKKILIVEDDEFNRFMMKSIIETLDVGMDVDLEEDGAAGCERIEKEPSEYALVLMDIHMPKLSGIAATKRIRANVDDPPCNIPIVAVTADANYHHPLAVEAEGMNGFLAKPIAPGELLGLIDRYCS